MPPAQVLLTWANEEEVETKFLFLPSASHANYVYVGIILAV